MSDTRMRVKELREFLNEMPDDAVLVVNVNGHFSSFYRVYPIDSIVRTHDILHDLNKMLGEKLTVRNKFVLMK